MRAAPARNAQPQYSPVESALSLAEVCDRMSLRLRWYGLPNLTLEQIQQMDEGQVKAIVRDDRSSRRLRWTVDPRLGFVTTSREWHEAQILQMPRL